MKIQNRKEFYLSVLLGLALLTLADIGIVYHFMTHIHMNGMLFEQVGMIQTKDGKNTLYFPVYKLKGDN